MTGVCFGNLTSSSLIFVSYSSLKFSLSLKEKIPLPRICDQSDSVIWERFICLHFKRLIEILGKSAIFNTIRGKHGLTVVTNHGRQAIWEQRICPQQKQCRVIPNNRSTKLKECWKSLVIIHQSFLYFRVYFPANKYHPTSGLI